MENKKIWFEAKSSTDDHSTTNSGLWFRAKRYGYGWYPTAWQGWAVLGLFIASVTLHTYNAISIATSAKDIILGINLPILIDVTFLIIICFLTGEKAAWRWGK